MRQSIAWGMNKWVWVYNKMNIWCINNKSNNFRMRRDIRIILWIPSFRLQMKIFRSTKSEIQEFELRYTKFSNMDLNPGILMLFFSHSSKQPCVFAHAYSAISKWNETCGICQCFSNFTVCMNQLGISLKCKFHSGGLK